MQVSKAGQAESDRALLGTLFAVCLLKRLLTQQDY
jgi:hypothetical protein